MSDFLDLLKDLFWISVTFLTIATPIMIVAGLFTWVGIRYGWLK